MRLLSKYRHFFLYLLIGFLSATILSMVFFSQNHSTFADSYLFPQFLTSSTSTSDPPSPARFVTIYDQQQKLIIKTTADTVRTVLERVHISLNDTDYVEPNLDTKIDIDNFFINIYRSHPVVLINQQAKTYTMSSSYDPVTIFREAGITVYDDDEIKPVFSDFFLETGVALTYELIRGNGQTVTLEEEVPFDTEYIKDYDIAVGTSEIRQLGEVGRKTASYAIFSIDGKETSRTLISETTITLPITRIIAVGASHIEQRPLTRTMGRNRYTITINGKTIERQETYYDLDMLTTLQFCGKKDYDVRESDGAKVDPDGYVMVAANLNRYPRCSVVETSLGPGKVYDTGAFALTNPEQFDLATNWTRHRTGRNESKR